MGRGLPSGWDQEARCVTAVGWQRLTDSNIPETWTDGTVSWHDVMARAHSYFEHINVYESRALLRSLEVTCKLYWTRHARVLALEDNSAVSGSWNKGRSRAYSLNQTLRKRAALECAGAVEAAVAWCSTGRMPMDRLSRERIVRR